MYHTYLKQGCMISDLGKNTRCVQRTELIDYRRLGRRHRAVEAEQ
jgi:hypothetical protein